jgi:DMSO/TMAO reductase YedYZ molybdopterin-dependent catalytic subunit
MDNEKSLDRQELQAYMRQAGRLPPGQVATDKFPVLHYGAIPPFNEVEWRFRVTGAVEKPLTLRWAEFQKLPRSSVRMDLHCVTRWSKFDTLWEGVRVRTLIDAGLIKLKPETHYVIQHAERDFTANLPLEIVLSDNFLLATHYDGQPITPEHGYPLRGVVGAIPGRKDLKDVYFWKGAKWLRSLEFSESDHKGFWEMAGYHNDADIWKEERIA